MNTKMAVLKVEAKQALPTPTHQKLHCPHNLTAQNNTRALFQVKKTAQNVHNTSQHITHPNNKASSHS
jgi:hypothetical protein